MIYVAGHSPALQFCTSALKESGFAVLAEPSMEVTQLLLPVPSFTAEGCIIGGGNLRTLLTLLPKDIVVIGGNLDCPELVDYRTVDLLQDADYLAINANITAHCAVKVAMNKMQIIFDGCEVLVIGWGRIGKCLAPLLKALGAKVTVAARKETDRAILQATGYGAVYYLQNVLTHENETIEGKTIAISGFGNVAWGICKKAMQLGAKVVTLSGPDGYIYDPDGVTTEEKVEYLVEMRNSGRNRVQDYAEKFGVEFFPKEKPWGVKVDVVMPSAMQNDVHMEHAQKIVEAGVKYYIEVANMPTTNDALEFLREQKHMIVAPSKAVNAGGVAVSGLEMSQNSERLVWTAEEVDEKLKGIMKVIHAMSVEAAEEYGLGYDLVAGANLAGFKKVATAMMEQGIF